MHELPHNRIARPGCIYPLFNKGFVEQLVTPHSLKKQLDDRITYYEASYAKTWTSG